MSNVTPMRKSPMAEAADNIGDASEVLVLAWTAGGELTIYDSGMELTRMCLAAQVLDAKCKREAGQMLSPEDIE